MLELGVKLFVKGIALVVANTQKKPFCMSHAVCIRSHHSSLHFSLSVSITLVMVGSYYDGLTGMVYKLMPVSLSYLSAPRMLASRP
jgi:hypothetical protein